MPRPTAAGPRLHHLLPVVLLPLLAACGGSADGADAPGPGDVVLAGRDTALRRLAGEILPEVEEASGLPARGPLRLGLRSRPELEAYLSAELDRQLPPAKAAALVRVYSRLGLLSDTTRLTPLLRSLYLEQVIGYYDPATDTLFVVEGVPAEQLEIVLSHEMVHALQDQYMDLDSLMRSLESDNDGSTAARAALEGHATFAMLEWFLSRTTGQPVNLTAFPDLGELLAANPGALSVGMPVLDQVPALVRESLLFPYLGGLAFMQGYWSAHPDRPLPLGEALPRSTEQILHPQRTAGRDPPLRVEFAAGTPEGWREVYADGLGELEIRILLAEHLRDEPGARRAAAGWGGDRYRLFDSPDGEVLAWVTAWDGELEAAEFEEAARRALAPRYAAPEGRRVTVERRGVDGVPVVVVVDAPAATPAGAAEAAARFDVHRP